MEFENPVLFSISTLPVTVYALCVALSVAAGLALFFHLGKRKRLPQDTVWRAALLALPLGLIGARIFYCVVRIYLYMEIGLDSVLRLWEGGYALWGAVGGAALAGVIAAKTTRRPVAVLMDTMAPPAALTIALARFSEYFSREGYGIYVENSFFQRFPFAVFDGYYEEWKWAVFMLEGIAALVILGVLLKKRRPRGDTARLFLLLYSTCQILLESLRRDSCLRWLFVRVSQLTAAIVIAVMMIVAVIRWIRDKENRRMSAGVLLLCWAVVLSSVGLCVALEFAADDKIWHEMPIWALYGLMACACACIGAAAYLVIFKSRKKGFILNPI